MSKCDNCKWLGMEFKHLRNHEEEGAVWHNCSYPLPYHISQRAVRKEYITECETWNASVQLEVE